MANFFTLVIDLLVLGTTTDVYVYRLMPLSFFCGDGGLIGFEFIHPFKRKTAV